MKVGIHHLNQGGVNRASMEVGLLMDEICDLFWNPAMCIHALCVEIESGDRYDEYSFRSWCAAAEVDLPPVPPGSLEAVALACSHTNCGLRAIDSKCESANPKLGDGSNYDIEVIRKRDQPFAEAVEEGLLWTVVRAVVLRMYPELVDLWTVARNTFGHVQRPENEVTGLAKLHASWAKQKKMGQAICYDAIVKNIAKGKPWWAPFVMDFTSFLGRHAGGIDGLHWKRFQAFHAHCVRSHERQMPGYMWEDLAQIHETLIVYAILMAAYLCPAEEGLEDKRCTWIKTTELKNLGAKAAMQTRTDAEVFLASLAKVFDTDGAFCTRATAAAVQRPGVKGYETLEKARHAIEEKSKAVYNKGAIMVGRYLCKKNQDEDFGKDKATNLGEILTRIHKVVREWFPNAGDHYECLDSIVAAVAVTLLIPVAVVAPKAKSNHKVAGAPATAGPDAGATAAAAIVMMELSEIDAGGMRTGGHDKLNANSMKVGSRVHHPKTKGTYEIAKVVEIDGGQAIMLRLCNKCISMEQLWKTLKWPEPEATDDLAVVQEPVVKELLQEAMPIGACSKASAKPHAKAVANANPAVVAAAELEVTAVAGDAELRATAAGESDESKATAAGETNGFIVEWARATAALERDFEDERQIVLDKFLDEWVLEISNPVEHVFNPSWPEERMALNQKYQDRTVIGLVYQAMWALGFKIDADIQPGNALLAVLKPAPAVFAFPGHPDAGNRSETQSRVGGEEVRNKKPSGATRLEQKSARPTRLFCVGQGGRRDLPNKSSRPTRP